MTASRLKGKPLLEINKLPIICHVLNKANETGLESFVATEDEEIVAAVEKNGGKAILTGKHKTGSDRIFEAFLKLKKNNIDFILNLQGDEPMIDPKDITKVIAVKKQHMDQVINGFCWLSSGEEPSNKNIPKIVTNANNQLLYASRSMVPGIKDACVDQVKFKKQVCIYAFTPEELNAFYQYGRIDPCEMLEDIEILRFMIMGRQVMMVETSTGSLAVDVREDVPIVEEALLS